MNEDLLRKDITVRGKQYTVTELDAETAAELRKRTAESGHGLDMLVAQRCCESPVITAAGVAKMPNFVVKKIAEAAMALGAEEPGAKND